MASPQYWGIPASLVGMLRVLPLLDGKVWTTRSHPSSREYDGPTPRDFGRLFDYMQRRDMKGARKTGSRIRLDTDPLALDTQREPWGARVHSNRRTAIETVRPPPRVTR